MTADKCANPKVMWDERYSHSDLVYGEAPNDFLQSQIIRLPPGINVFVPADGYGRNGIWLAKQGFRVHTVDLSPVGVERARKAAAAAGVTMKMEVADLVSWQWPLDAFDAVVAIFFHIPSAVRPKIHASMLGALKPGGLVILQAFTPAQLQFTSGGPKQVDLLYTAESLRHDFADAEIVLLEEQVTQLNEGHLHSGPGAVVQAVFRRN